MKLLTTVLLVGVFEAASAQAANLSISIGLRETGGAGPALANAGTTGGIEWVNLDGQVLNVDGSWQQFTFTPSVDTLSAFAGATADGILDGQWGSLEHIRIRNTDGITTPISLWVDDVSVNEAAGSTIEGFESNAVGDKVMFQVPSFSGSTSGNLVAGSGAGVTDATALTGSQSYEANFQFVDNDPARWVRFTTFNAANFPNPFIRTVEPGAPAPTLTFSLKAVTIPEPTSVVLLGLSSLGLLVTRRR